MFNWLGNLFGRRTVAKSKRHNPVRDFAVQRAAETYNEIPLKEFIDEERRAKLARDLFLEVNRVCATADPVTECREHLVATMLKFASYQVLVIPPEPEADPSGLRAQPGITGELREHLVTLCAKNDVLRSTMFEITDSNEFDDLWEILQRLYWESFWLLETLNATRIGLKDSVEHHDWYPEFLYATCVSLEHTYRWELELPPAFDESIARDAASVYPVFADIVLSGAADPGLEWRDYSRGMNVPTPDFDESMR
ncbi:MAG: hypothetical protein OEV34_10345 [Gammaproteobacteria bacterium]|nr:hypothetical protein [Gammaproteobacteria bacterium]